MGGADLDAVRAQPPDLKAAADGGHTLTHHLQAYMPPVRRGWLAVVMGEADPIVGDHQVPTPLDLIA